MPYQFIDDNCDIRPIPKKEHYLSDKCPSDCRTFQDKGLCSCQYNLETLSIELEELKSVPLQHEEIVNFGKHKGKTFSVVYAMALQYCLWYSNKSHDDFSSYTKIRRNIENTEFRINYIKHQSHH